MQTLRLAFSAVARSYFRMRHARADDLDRLEPLLARLRRFENLKEKSRGTFYRGSRAFLHFHADGSRFFADLRVREDFERFGATTAAEQKELLGMIATVLAKSK